MRPWLHLYLYCFFGIYGKNPLFEILMHVGPPIFGIAGILIASFLHMDIVVEGIIDYVFPDVIFNCLDHLGMNWWFVHTPYFDRCGRFVPHHWWNVCKYICMAVIFSTQISERYVANLWSRFCVNVMYSAKSSPWVLYLSSIWYMTSYESLVCQISVIPKSMIRQRSWITSSYSTILLVCSSNSILSACTIW